MLQFLIFNVLVIYSPFYIVGIHVEETLERVFKEVIFENI